MSTTKKKGRLIVIDGADGSGKATQTKLLLDKLNSLNHETATIDFPRRENFFGQFIYKCLEEGECGDFSSVHPRIASALYAADRWLSKDQIVGWLESGKNVIADRYASANQIHQGGKIKDEAERKAFMEFLDQMEYEQFKIPRPDIVFYLNVPFAISLRLMEERKKEQEANPQRRKTDQHEDNPEHQIAARESAIKMLSDKSWIKIECSDDGENILPREIIHERILEHCLKIL